MSRGDLVVRAVIAVVAEDERVFADRRDVHELVRDPASHHPDVARHHDHRKLDAAENVQVRLTVRLVCARQTRLVGIEAVRVLHDELAHANQTGTRARLVAKFGLELVDDLRKLPVGRDFRRREAAGDLLVRHREQHVVPATVLEPCHGVVDRRPAPGCDPRIGGLHDGHSELLTADTVDLFPNDLLDVAYRAPRGREIQKMPAASGRMYPAFISSLCESVSASFGASRSVVPNSVETRISLCSCTKRASPHASRRRRESGGERPREANFPGCNACFGDATLATRRLRQRAALLPTQFRGGTCPTHR